VCTTLVASDKGVVGRKIKPTRNIDMYKHEKTLIEKKHAAKDSELSGC